MVSCLLIDFYLYSYQIELLDSVQFYQKQLSQTCEKCVAIRKIFCKKYLLLFLIFLNSVYMLEINGNKCLCAMAMAGVIALGNVAEGSIEQFKAEQEAAKKTKKPLLVLPNVPECAEEQGSDTGTAREDMSPAEVSEKSEASAEKAEELCLFRVVENGSSEASYEQVDEDTQYPLGRCYVLGYGSEGDSRIQDLKGEIKEEDLYCSEDPVKRKLWEKRLKKAGFPVFDIEDVVLPYDGEDLLKFKERLAGMDLNIEVKRRSFEKACNKRAEANEKLWYSLLDDEISQEEIEEYLDENLSAEQKAKMCKNSSKLPDWLDVESYEKLIYALLKFGLLADEILVVRCEYLPKFCPLDTTRLTVKEGCYQCHFSNDSSTMIFLHRDTLKNEEKQFLMRCLMSQAPIHSISVGSWGLKNNPLVKQLGQGLEISRVLRDLRIDSCAIGDKGAKILGDALKHNSKLESLTLKGNRISNTGAVAISEGLRANSTLQKLYLENENIGSVGMVAIATAVRDNSSITELILKEIPVTDRGAFAVKDMLEKNSSLTTLAWFPHDVMSSTQAGYVAEGLKNNSSLTTLILHRSSPEGIGFMADAMESNITITKFMVWCEKK